MRLWSIHPKYLDAKGLVALWRETLLAKKVLEGKTQGYRRHPQLDRFRNSGDPLAVINTYLKKIHAESEIRGYRFDNSKFTESSTSIMMNVTSGQMEYEIRHLLQKLEIRDNNKFIDLQAVEVFEPHPLFTIVPGEIESWEIVRNK